MIDAVDLPVLQTITLGRNAFMGEDAASNKLVMKSKAETIE